MYSLERNHGVNLIVIGNDIDLGINVGLKIGSFDIIDGAEATLLLSCVKELTMILLELKYY